MQLQYNVYTQVAAQLQQAEMKVQQETPAFTTLQSATVPVKKSGPSRAKICLIFTFLAFLGVSVWILNKENQLKPLLNIGRGCLNSAADVCYDVVTLSSFSFKKSDN